MPSCAASARPRSGATIIHRMVRYGSRLADARTRGRCPRSCQPGWRKLREHPIRSPRPRPGARRSPARDDHRVADRRRDVARCTTCCSPQNGLVYVADNIQDRLYEIDPQTNEVTVYKIPHRDGDKNGGLLAGRLKDFPKHDSTSNAHSLAESREGRPHLHHAVGAAAPGRVRSRTASSSRCTRWRRASTRTPSASTTQDRVWFTLALSNQIAMFDRTTRRFTLYDLPTRGFREWLTVAADPLRLQADQLGRAALQLAADRSPGHRHAAALRHRHHARRQGLVRAPAHRRDRLPSIPPRARSR